MEKKTRHIFYNEAEKGVKYVLHCDVPMSQSETWEKFLPWVEAHGRFSPPFVPRDIHLRVTNDGQVIPLPDPQD